MKKIIYLFVANILFIQINAQNITLEFKNIDEQYKNKVYVIDATEMGNLSIASSAFLVDSITIFNKKATINLSKYKKEGFYRLQCVQNNKNGFAYKMLSTAKCYSFYDAKEKNTSILQLESSNNFKILNAKSSNSSLKNFYNEYDALQIIIKATMDSVKDGKISQEQFFNKMIKTFASTYKKSNSIITKYYTGQELVVGSSMMSKEDFKEIVHFKLSEGFNSMATTKKYFKAYKFYLDNVINPIKLNDVLNIIVEDKNGIVTSLKVDTGLVVIDFWASWCKPCRSENKTTFQKLKNLKKCSIISISFDDNRQNWLSANNEDIITWDSYLATNATTTEFYKRYVSDGGLPQNIVLYNGQIVGQTLLGELLERQCEAILKSNK